MRQRIYFSVLKLVICWLNRNIVLHVHVYMHFSTSSRLFSLVYSIKPPRIHLTSAVNLEPMWETFLTRHTSTKQRENKLNFTLLGFKSHHSNVYSHSPQRKDCVQGLLGKKRSPIGVKDVRTGWRVDRGWFLPRQWPPQRQWMLEEQSFLEKKVRPEQTRHPIRSASVAGLLLWLAEEEHSWAGQGRSLTAAIQGLKTPHQ